MSRGSIVAFHPGLRIDRPRRCANHRRTRWSAPAGGAVSPRAQSQWSVTVLRQARERWRPASLAQLPPSRCTARPGLRGQRDARRRARYSRPRLKHRSSPPARPKPYRSLKRGRHFGDLDRYGRTRWAGPYSRFPPTTRLPACRRRYSRSALRRGGGDPSGQPTAIGLDDGWPLGLASRPVRARCRVAADLCVLTTTAYRALGRGHSFDDITPRHRDRPPRRAKCQPPLRPPFQHDARNIHTNPARTIDAACQRSRPGAIAPLCQRRMARPPWQKRHPGKSAWLVRALDRLRYRGKA